jgi:hypothetical protein
MPLKDHFHPPLAPRRLWNSFDAAWATYISSALNNELPPGYYAEPQCKFVVEIDVAAFEEGAEEKSSEKHWEPSAPALTVATAATTDTVEVQVFRTGGGDLVLAGCIELVSPSNKDRPAEREAFVTKCANYLHQGAGLLIVDVVTERHANLHAALLSRLAPKTDSVLEANLYTSAYRPERQKKETLIRVWQESLALGEPLPTLPLWLKDGPCMVIALEATYDQTCRQLRIIKNGGPA